MRQDLLLTYLLNVFSGYDIASTSLMNLTSERVAKVDGRIQPDGIPRNVEVLERAAFC